MVIEPQYPLTFGSQPHMNRGNVEQEIFHDALNLPSADANINMKRPSSIKPKRSSHTSHHSLEARSPDDAMVLSVLYVAALARMPLPPMPYDYEALEPHIDAATMRVHHLKHHQRTRTN